MHAAYENSLATNRAAIFDAILNPPPCFVIEVPARKPGRYARALARHLIKNEYVDVAPCGTPYTDGQPIMNSIEMRTHLEAWFGPDIPTALAIAGDVLQALRGMQP